MNNKEIIDHVRRNGFFRVTWRYRDSGIRSQCHGLVYKGVLKKDFRGHGADHFILGSEDSVERYLRNEAQKTARKTKEKQPSL